MNFVECCRKLIALDTSPTGDCRSAGEYLAELGKQLGFHVELQQESLNGLEQSNVILRPQKKSEIEEFMLQTHLDTVDPGSYSFWTKTAANPFNASIYGKDIFGIGVADTKLDFLCKIFACRPFLSRKFIKRSFVLVGTYGAHSGMAGALKLVRKNKVNTKYALIGEPTDLTLMQAGQGLAVVEVSIPFGIEERQYRREHDVSESASSQSKIFSGRAAHSTMPHLGENAITKMFSFLENLPSGIVLMEVDGGVSYNSVPASAFLEFDLVGGIKHSVVEKIIQIWQTIKKLEKQFHQYRDDSFSYPYSSLNVGLIRTSEEEVVMTGSCRLLPQIKEEIYLKWMEMLSSACREAGAHFKVRDYQPSFVTDITSELVKICQESLDKIHLSSEPGKLSACTEASVFQRLGIQCLAFGPGKSFGNSHAPNENINMDDLERATHFYQFVVERFCQ